jgi:hypothetical protein
MFLLREGRKTKLQVPEKKVIKKIFDSNIRSLLSGWVICNTRRLAF